MITINKNIIELAKEVKKIHDYIMIIVDYDKEEKYSNLLNELSNELYKLDKENDLSPNCKDAIIQVLQESEDIQELYLYDSDEIIEVLFPDTIKKNLIIQSAYNWIESSKKIEWLIMNVFEAPSSKEWYNVIDNINDNYIISTKKLSNIK